MTRLLTLIPAAVLLVPHQAFAAGQFEKLVRCHNAVAPFSYSSVSLNDPSDPLMVVPLEKLNEKVSGIGKNCGLKPYNLIVSAHEIYLVYPKSDACPASDSDGGAMRSTLIGRVPLRFSLPASRNRGPRTLYLTTRWRTELIDNATAGSKIYLNGGGGPTETVLSEKPLSGARAEYAGELQVLPLRDAQAASFVNVEEGRDIASLVYNQVAFAVDSVPIALYERGFNELYVSNGEKVIPAPGKADIVRRLETDPKENEEKVKKQSQGIEVAKTLASLTPAGKIAAIVLSLYGAGPGADEMRKQGYVFTAELIDQEKRAAAHAALGTCLTVRNMGSSVLLGPDTIQGKAYAARVKLGSVSSAELDKRVAEAIQDYYGQEPLDQKAITENIRRLESALNDGKGGK